MSRLPQVGVTTPSGLRPRVMPIVPGSRPRVPAMRRRSGAATAGMPPRITAANMAPPRGGHATGDGDQQQRQAWNKSKFDGVIEPSVPAYSPPPRAARAAEKAKTARRVAAGSSPRVAQAAGLSRRASSRSPNPLRRTAVSSRWTRAKTTHSSTTSSLRA